MFSIKTRSYGLDYSMRAFNTLLSSSWLTKYCKPDTKLNYIRDDSNIDIYLETDMNKWVLYFGKIPSYRKSSAGQTIYSSIIAEGQMTDDDSKKLLYKLLYNAFKSSSIRSNIETILTPVFEKTFDEEFINSLDAKRNDEESNKIINQKISSFITELPNDLENRKLIELNNLEFNNFNAKEQKTELLSLIYSLLFSKSQENKKIFVCTSTKLNQDKINHLKTSLEENTVGLILTTSEDDAINLPQIFNTKIRKPQAETSGKITHINILAIAISSFIVLITGYFFTAWNLCYWPYQKKIVEHKIFYTKWSEKDADGKEIAYFKKDLNSTELFIEFCSLEKPVSLTLDETDDVVTITIKNQSPEEYTESKDQDASKETEGNKESVPPAEQPDVIKESKTTYILTADANTKKERKVFQRIIRLFGKEKSVGKIWIEEE